MAKVKKSAVSKALVLQSKALKPSVKAKAKALQTVKIRVPALIDERGNYMVFGWSRSLDEQAESDAEHEASLLEEAKAMLATSKPPSQGSDALQVYWLEAEVMVPVTEAKLAKATVQKG